MATVSYNPRTVLQLRLGWVTEPRSHSSVMPASRSAPASFTVPPGSVLMTDEPGLCCSRRASVGKGTSPRLSYVLGLLCRSRTSNLLPLRSGPQRANLDSQVGPPSRYQRGLPAGDQQRSLEKCDGPGELHLRERHWVQDGSHIFELFYLLQHQHHCLFLQQDGVSRPKHLPHWHHRWALWWWRQLGGQVAPWLPLENAYPVGLQVWPRNMYIFLNFCWNICFCWHRLLIL